MSPAPVSVVIPAYESAAHLPGTIASVREQSVEVDEIIVVDDGSADETAAVARSHGVRLVRHEANRGVSAARNTGIRAARNEWIAMLDADDVWKPEKIARQYGIVQRYPDVGLVFSDREHVRDGDTVLPRFLPDHEPYHDVAKTSIGDAAYRLEGAAVGRALFPGNFIKPSTLLLRRSLFERVGGFDERFTAPGSPIGTCEDQDLSLRLVVHTDPVVVEAPLVRYRLREGSVSSDTIGLLLGYAYLAEKVIAEPHRYPAGAAEYFRDRRPEVLHEAAVLCMHEGSFDMASGLLRRSLRDGVTLRALLSLLACGMGDAAFARLVRLKRSLRLPGLR